MRKLTGFALMLLMLVAAFGQVAFAADNIEIVTELIDEANEQIQGKIDEAVLAADELLENYDVNDEGYASALDGIINNLVDETNEISKNTIQQASDYGVEVICEWELVKIGNREVWIDPLRIIGD